ncbi:hypothetical protein KM620_gp046 [Hyposidra talaca nucleopolyhedrovirus]|uniref:Uncharacterized protein n=1 Tax=Hyposidra talaca nucleopolyhedrovirus TaxID=1070315 RepID=A0A2Z4HI02_9ABAC|nr:hypothetical protein KM620_gp046 [Hyposidra talaca nucleopolyhedrovirus]AWW14406.1 hypothetical protein HytaNPV_gp046 [Hyposidra talaca nucleopolyhedrovirus]
MFFIIALTHDIVRSHASHNFCVFFVFRVKLQQILRRFFLNFGLDRVVDDLFQFKIDFIHYPSIMRGDTIKLIFDSSVRLFK